MPRKITRRMLSRQLTVATSTMLAFPHVYAATRATPSQTEGPFYPVHQALDLDADLTRTLGNDGIATGVPINVSGTVRDIQGTPLDNVIVDVWQANHHGKYMHPADRNPAPEDPNFQGWAKLNTDTDGAYSFTSILPGPYSLSTFGGSGVRCRHIHFKVLREGYNDLTTQMYFPDDPLIEHDSVMAGTPVEQRELLIARSIPTASGDASTYQFDIFISPT